MQHLVHPLLGQHADPAATSGQTELREDAVQRVLELLLGNAFLRYNPETKLFVIQPPRNEAAWREHGLLPVFRDGRRALHFTMPMEPARKDGLVHPHFKYGEGDHQDLAAFHPDELKSRIQPLEAELRQRFLGTTFEVLPEDLAHEGGAMAVPRESTMREIARLVLKTRKERLRVDQYSLPEPLVDHIIKVMGSEVRVLSPMALRSRWAMKRKHPFAIFFSENVVQNAYYLPRLRQWRMGPLEVISKGDLSVLVERHLGFNPYQVVFTICRELQADVDVDDVMLNAGITGS